MSKQHNQATINLLKACREGDLTNVAETLARKLSTSSHEPDVNAYDEYGKSPMHYAVDANNLLLIELLHEKGARIEELIDPDTHLFYIHTAMKFASREVMKFLCSHRDLKSSKDAAGKSLLEKYIEKKDHEMVRFLMENGYYISSEVLEKKDSLGATKLTEAVTSDDLNTAEMLLESGANPDCVDILKKTPLLLATGNGSLDMVKLLVRYKANIHHKDMLGKGVQDYVGFHNDISEYWQTMFDQYDGDNISTSGNSDDSTL